MLRAIGHPISFVGLALGFLAAVVLATLVQHGCARLLGLRTTPRPAGAAGLIDPYGTVAAVLGGPGWGVVGPPTGRSRARRCVALATGPVIALALGAGLLAAFAVRAGGAFILDGADLGQVLSGVTGETGQVLLACAGLEAVTVGLLMLVPLPPLTGWHIMSLFMRPTLGWQRARLQLEERNFGILILLILTVLPLGNQPLLVALLDWIVGRILAAVAG